MVICIHQGQATIAPIALYAATLPEFPDIDNNDWEHPDYYSSYAKQRKDGYLSFLYNLGFAGKTILLQDVARLINYANTITQPYKPHGVAKINPSVDAQCVLFGDLGGAFHSLMRDIEQLISMGIISDDFKISQNSYFIFNGNIIGDSPYNMQTLYVVLQLLINNPEKVIYIQGTAEQQWLTAESQLYQQLIALNASKTQLEQLAIFFDTLPSCLYIIHNDKAVAVDGGTSIIPATMPIVASIIAGHEHKTIGLRRYIGPPTSWSLFSSPTGINRRLHAFLYDTFALIRIQPDIHNWTLTFYHTDARVKKSFSEPSTYNLVIGNLMQGPILPLYDRADIERLKKEVVQLEARVQELTELCLLQEKKQTKEVIADLKQILAIHERSIVFGCTLDLARSIRNQSESLQEGLLAKMNALNETGGLNGKQVQIIFLDDAYTPSKARKNAKRFVDEFKTDVLLCPVGTSTLEYYLDLVTLGKLLILFPITGSLLFKQTDFENLIQFRPSYADELVALTDYVITKYHAKKFLIFYQKDSYGEMNKEVVKKFLDERGIQRYQEFFYERNELNFTSRLGEIKTFNPDTIIFISTATAAQSLIRQMGAGYFVDKHLYGTSNNFGEASFKNFMKLKGLNFFVANVVPNPENSTIELAQEFRNKAKQTNMIIDTLSFEGYIMASLTEYIFTQIKGTLSQENIVTFARAIKDMQFKGLHLDFNASFNRLSNKIWISESNDPNWIEIDLQGGTFGKQD